MTADTPNLEAITSETALSRWPIGSVEREIVACARTELSALKAREGRLRVALEEIIKAWDHKTGDYYVDNYLSDVEIDAARAALAAQGGGT